MLAREEESQPCAMQDHAQAAACRLRKVLPWPSAYLLPDNPLFPVCCLDCCHVDVIIISQRLSYSAWSESIISNFPHTASRRSSSRQAIQRSMQAGLRLLRFSSMPSARPSATRGGR